VDSSGVTSLSKFTVCSEEDGGGETVRKKDKKNKVKRRGVGKADGAGECE